MSKLLDLYIDQGCDFTAVLPPVIQPDETVVDLTGYTVTCQIRRSYATVFAVQLTCVIESEEDGIISLSLSKEETAGLSLRYVYDVVVELITAATETSAATSVSTKVFEGLVIVNPGVSSKPNTTLLTPYVPDDFGGL